MGWIAGAIVLICAVSALRGKQGLAGPFELFQQIRELQKVNRELESQNGEKQERLRRLEEGKSETELEVKRRLKYLNRGEVQMVLPGGSKTTAPSSTGQDQPAAPGAAPESSTKPK